MSKHFDLITGNPDDYSYVLDAHDYFISEYEIYKEYLNVQDSLITTISAKIPGLSEKVYSIWSELKAIIEHLELRNTVALQKARKFYIESYNRQLGSHQIENYAKANDEVIATSELIIRMNLILNKWEGVSKGVERLSYQLRILVDMRKAGLEDTTI